MAQNDIVIGIRMDMINAQRALKKFQKNVKTAGLKTKKYATAVNEVAKGQQKMVEQTTRLKKAMGQSPFKGWALSVMFAGMALKRMFDTIWKSSTKTFQEVMHSVEGSVTGFDILNGSIAYLGFTAGQALEPIAEFIAPIIDKITEWIGDNEELFRGIVVALGAGGVVLTAIGMTTLALTGLGDMIILMGPAWTKMIGILLANPIAAAIGIAALAAMWVIWQADLGDIKDGIQVWLDDIGALFGDLSENSKTAFGGLMDFINGTIEGDLEKQEKGFGEFFEGVAMNFVDVWGTAVTNIMNGFIWLWNVWADLAGGALKMALSWAERFIKALNKIPGVNISTGFIDDLKEVIDAGVLKSKVDFVSYQDVKAQYIDRKENLDRAKQAVVYADKIEIAVARGEDPLDVLNRLLGEVAANAN